MKKLISVLLCALILIPSAAGLIPAEALDSSAVTAGECRVEAQSGCIIESDEYLGAAVIIPEDGSADVTLSCKSGDNAFLIAWLPAGYGEGITLTLNGRDTNIAAAHKFEALPLGTVGEAVSLAYSADGSQRLYVYGVCDESEKSDMLSAANGSLDAYSEEYLDLDYYDLSRYTEYYWDDGVVFNESFFLYADSDGNLTAPGILFDIDRVISVQDARLETEYVYGVDYTVEDGKLVILPDSAITVYAYSDIFRDTQPSASWRRALDGSYALCGQLPLYFTGYFNISYTKASSWEGATPEPKGELLPNLSSKLNGAAGESVRILSVGDSMAGGANASSEINVPPYADRWSDMIAYALAERYPDKNIEHDTIAQGGATASLCISRMSQILAYAPDVIIIEFGANECDAGDDPYMAGGYVDTLNEAIAAINEALPLCDIILVAPTITNPIFFPSEWFYAYADSLYPLERQGVAVADVTALMQYMLTSKRYIDMTGDFLCHPNDYVSRLVVQCLLATMESGSESEYINGLAERILNYRYSNEFDEEGWAEYTALAVTASEAVKAADSADAAREAYISYAKQLDAVETASDKIAAATFDGTKLVFSNAKSVELVENVYNCGAKYDDGKKAIVATMSAVRSPYITFSYSLCENSVSADEYKYAVVTAKYAETNSVTSTLGKLSFSVGGATAISEKFTAVTDGAYHSYIVDMSGISKWQGGIASVSVFPFEKAAAGDVYEISSVFLCANEEEATDVAIERERIANGTVAAAVSTVISSDENAADITCNSEVIICGDADGNGKLNAKDILFVRWYLAEMENVELSPSADYDGDGEVTPADALSLRYTLAGRTAPTVITYSDANISYSTEMEAAEITALTDCPTVKADLSAYGISADTYKYFTVCAKAADQSEVNVSVRLITESGDKTESITLKESEFFTADTARFTSLEGAFSAVEFTFDIEEGATVYLDSFVFTSTISSALNAEAVRIGAANLIQ